jgi:predicted Fe-Mo cluster-binding NifX family protein
MKIAIPLAGGLLSQHFGHCETIAFYDVRPETKEIERVSSVAPPEHAPGVLPAWLHSEGVDLVIVGGMGSHARTLLSGTGIRVVTGAPLERPEALVRAYLDDTLITGDNPCDH